MMESQGPVLTKGFPHQETGATTENSETTSDDIDYQHRNAESLEGTENVCSPSDLQPSSSSAIIENELTITKKCNGSTNDKHQTNQDLPHLSEECCDTSDHPGEECCPSSDHPGEECCHNSDHPREECCHISDHPGEECCHDSDNPVEECCHDSDHPGTDQNYFTTVGGNIEDQLTHFRHGDTVGDDEMEISFPRSVYGEIVDKDVSSFHGAGEVGQLEGEHMNMRIKTDFNIINVDGRVVPEYIRTLHPLVSPSVQDLVQCPSTAVENDHTEQMEEVSSSSMKTSSINKVLLETSPTTQEITQNHPPEHNLSDAVLLPEQKNPGGITIQVYPQNQGISLVTSSSILSANMATFSSHMPAILTEGDAEDSDAHCGLTDQFQVVTTSSVLNNNSGGLDVMTSSTDFGRNVLLTEQQQVLLSGMLVPGATSNQAVHINVSQDASTCTCMDVDGQQEHQGDECVDGKGHACPHPDCNKVCPKAYKLKLHMLAHTGERPYKCPHEGCEWAFTTAYKLKRHVRGHTGEKPFMCAHEGCGKCFTTAYNLKTHVRVHFRTDTHICSYEGCDKTFPTGHKLTVHERKHQAEQKLYRCEVEGCGKVFSAIGSLTSHLKAHTGERPHSCPVEGCEKRFTKASKLKLHLRSHTGERPFACQVEACGWSFTSAYKLKRHMRKHTGERPFLCRYEGCCKSFTRSSHLKTHMLVHTGVKPYVCPVDGCNKAFTAGSSLNVHMCKHTGQKPFKCDIDGCAKTYTTAANLRAHQKRHGNKALSVEFNAPSHSDLQTELCTVSCGSATSETEPEVTYTTIGSFNTSDFNLDDASRLTSVGVHLPTSSTTLCALVTSTGNPLSSTSTEVGLDSERKHLEVENCTVRSRVEVSPGVQRERFVSESLDDNTKLDVTEFVVRSEDRDMITHRAHPRVDAVEAAVLEGAKLVGGFDLCITSMMSHITSEEGQVTSSSAVRSRARKQSTALDFRDVHPEDQFAPPAVIFQDEVKTSDTETESEVIVAHIHQSPEVIPVMPASQQALQSISIPQGLPPIHLQHSLEPAVATVHVPNVEPMEIDTVVSDTRLGSIPSPPGVHEEEGGLGKGDLSPYMEHQSSSEQEEGNGESYPESTINLQDLR